MKKQLICALTAILLFIMPNVNFGQAPDLGVTSSFALFTASGAMTNEGASIVNGNIGTYVGAFTGFPPGIVIGNIYTEGNSVSFQAAGDVDAAYTDLSERICTYTLGTPFGNGQTLTPGVHCIVTAAALQGELILDAEGDPDAIFIIKVNGALASSTNSSITLVNSACLDNVYWQVGGAFTAGENSVMRGTIVADGQIELLKGSTLYGRALTRAGAILLHNNEVTLPVPPEAPAVDLIQPTCFIPTGTIEVTSPLSADYTYSINGLDYQSGTTFSGLTPGSYNVMAKYFEGCVPSPVTVAVIEEQPLTPAAPVVSLTQPTCEVATGTIEVNSPLGSGYTNSINGVDYQSETTFSVLNPGSYNVTVKSADGCVSSAISAVIEEQLLAPAAPTVSLIQPTCEVAGSASITNYSSDYSYTFTPAGPGVDASGNITGFTTGQAYTVTATNADNCTSAASVTFTIEDVLAGPDANAGSDKELTSTITEVTLDGSSSTAGVNYQWSTPDGNIVSGGNTATPTVDAIGSYTLTVTAPNECTDTDVVVVTEDAVGPIAGITNNTGTTVLTTSVPLISVTATGGVSYSWSDGTNVVGTDADLTITSPGTYTVTVTDDNGNTATTSIIITQGGVVPAASLTIEKVADKNVFYKAGEVINYTITVANTGNVSLTGVQVKDKLSKGKFITELAVYPEGGDLDGDNILDVGETWIYKASYTVTQSDIDYFISTKSASLLKCAPIVELINVATVVTNQTAPQSDDATSILETYVLGNNIMYRSATKVANRRAAPVTFREAGAIKSISIYHNGGTGNVLLGVYSNQSSSPLTRLGVTESTAVNPKTGWQTVTLSSPVKVASGQTVWLSWVFENNPGVRYTTGTPGRRESTGTWSSGMPETFGTANYAAYKYSIYCSYTTDDVATLAVSPASISLNYSSGASGTFDISSNTNWSITDDAGWLDVSSVSGINNGTITLTANSANTETNPRTATVSIAGAGVTTKTVTVTQDNQATTLGNTKVFGSVTKVANRRAVPVTFSEAGTINSISIYHNGGIGNVLLGVYSNQSGSPFTRLGVTESTAINPIAGWQTVSLSSPVNVISGQTVWLSWVFQNNPGVRYTTGTPGRKESTGTWSSGMPETFGEANNAAYKYSIYCSYIADESKSAEIGIEIKPAFESADLKVYPNPFSDKLRFEFVSPESVNARIDLYDMTGRTVKTIFEQTVEGGVSYEAEFEPENSISGMYIFRMTMGDAIYIGKVIFKKE